MSVVAATFNVLAQSYGRGMLESYRDALFSVTGATAIVGFLAVATLLIIVDRAKWALIPIAAFVSSCIYVPKSDTQPLPPPFSFIGMVSQPITASIVLLLALPALRPAALPRRHLLHPVVPFLFVFQLFFCARLIAGPYAEKGAIAVFAFVLMVSVLGFGLPRWVYDGVEVRKLVKAMSWAGALLVLATLYVLAVKPRAAFFNMRLYGTTPNPQRLATYLALTIPFSVAVFVDRRHSLSSRYLHIVMAAFAGVAIAGTGSRTGALMTLVGLGLYFRHRLGVGLGVTVVLTAVGLAVYSVFGESLAVGQERLLNTENTRKVVWLAMIDQFLESPLYGIAREQANENSFLSVAAGMGLVGLIPVTLFSLVFARAGFQSLRWRSRAGEDRPLADLVVASVGQFFACWMFEGSLIGTLTDHMIMLYCLFGLMSYCRERMKGVEDPASSGEQNLHDGNTNWSSPGGVAGAAA
jgi:O-antigen ligase